MSRKITTEQYVEQIKDKPFTCLENYIGANKPILHICNVCSNKWLCTPSHIKRGTGGCPICAGNAVCTTEQYIESIKSKPVVCLGSYISSRAVILHKCTICNNEWLVIPSSIKSGSGCPVCSNCFKQNKPAYMYMLLIENSTETFLKIGITNRTPDLRCKEIIRTCSEDSVGTVLYALHSDNGKFIYDLEQEIHSNKQLKQFITLNEYMDGRTELYDYQELNKLKEYF